jgi:hypothetical protein
MILIVSLLILAIVLALNYQSKKTTVQPAIPAITETEETTGAGILIFSAGQDLRPEIYGLYLKHQAIIVNGEYYAQDDADNGLGVITITDGHTFNRFRHFDLAGSPKDCDELIRHCQRLPVNTVLSMGVKRTAAPDPKKNQDWHRRLAILFDRLGARVPPTKEAKASWAYVCIRRPQGWVPLAESYSLTKGISMAFQVRSDLAYYDDFKAEVLFDRSEVLSLTETFGKADFVTQPLTKVERPVNSVRRISMQGIRAQPPYGAQATKQKLKDNRIVWRDLKIGPHARFESYLGLDSDHRTKSDGVAFMVVVDDEIIGQREVGVDQNELDDWIPWTVDLGRFANRRVSFELRVGPKGNNWSDHSVWGDPVIVSMPGLARGPQAPCWGCLDGLAKAYFTRPVPKKDLFAESTLPAPALANLIDNAQSQVLFCMFRFNHTELVDALLAANKRGLEVRVLTDQDYWTSTYADSYETLRQSGIEVRVEQSIVDTVMHHKFVVLDRSTVWTGDWNAHTNDSYKAYHTALHIYNQDLADIYAQAFESLWEGQVPDSISTILAASGKSVVTPSGAMLTAYFPPAHPGADVMTKAVAQAKRSVQIVHSYINNRGLIVELVRAAQRGVDVRIVYGSTHGRIEKALALHNVDARKGKMFIGCKYAVIDDWIFITGSWNAGTIEADFENIIEMRGVPVLCRRFRTYFEYLYANSPPFYADKPDSHLLATVDPGRQASKAIEPHVIYENPNCVQVVGVWADAGSTRRKNETKVCVEVEYKAKSADADYLLDFYLTPPLTKSGPELDPRNRPIALPDISEPGGNRRKVAEFVMTWPEKGTWLANTRIVRVDPKGQRKVVGAYAVPLEQLRMSAMVSSGKAKRLSLIEKFDQASVMKAFTSVYRPATVGGVRMDGIFAHPPFGEQAEAYKHDYNSISWPRLKMGKNPWFDCKLGFVHGHRSKSNGVDFMVVVNNKVVATRIVGADPKEPDVWISWTVDLSEFTDRTVSFELRVGPRGSDRSDHAIWGNPTIVYQAAAPARKR